MRFSSACIVACENCDYHVSIGLIIATS